MVARAFANSQRGPQKLGKELLEASVEGLATAQDPLYADDRWSLLVVFQAMDAAGKDSTIKRVMSGVNPQGCSVTHFKQPSTEELDHNHLWRTWKAVPARGQIGIFNRSHYEGSSRRQKSTRSSSTPNVSRTSEEQTVLAEPLRRHQQL